MNVVETRFVVKYGLTTEATLKVLEDTRLRFSIISGKLYGEEDADGSG
jgi:hypothetical protein